jgi:hypothetical protein
MTNEQDKRMVAAGMYPPLPDMETDTGLAEFYSGEAKAIIAQYQHIEHLLKPKGDWTGPGTHCEVLLRDFLRRNLPVGIAVDKGFIHGRLKDGEEIRQCPEIDILIHNSLSYRPIFRLEEFVIVQPEAVLGMIQVKRSLEKTEVLRHGLENIAKGMRHMADSAMAVRSNNLHVTGFSHDYCANRKVFSALVGFDDKPRDSESLEMQIRAVHTDKDFGLTEYDEGFRVWMLPAFVGSLQGCFATNWTRQTRYEGRLDFYDSFCDDKNVVLQALLWLATSCVWRNRNIHVDGSHPPRFGFPKGMSEKRTFYLFPPHRVTSMSDTKP